MADKRVDIPGSAPRHLENAPRLSPVPASQQLEVTVILRHNPAMEDVGEQLLSGVFQAKSLAQTASYTQAAADDIDSVKKFAAEFGLQVVSSDVAARTIKLSGTPPQFDRAFNTQLTQSGDYRTYYGPLTVPQDFAGILIAVLGLDNRPIATHHTP